MNLFGRRKQPPADVSWPEIPEVSLIDPNVHFWVEPMGWTAWCGGPMVGATTVFTQMEIDHGLAAQLKTAVQPLMDGLAFQLQAPAFHSGSHAISIVWEPTQNREKYTTIVNAIAGTIIEFLCRHFGTSNPKVVTVERQEGFIDNPLLRQLNARNTWHK